MKQKVILDGGSTSFTGIFKKTVTDCGFVPVIRGSEENPVREAAWVVITEVLDREGLGRLPTAEPVRPFLIYTDLDLSRTEILPLKAKGLVGVITPGSSTEDINFLVNKALFYDQIMGRNPRAPVNIPVVLKSGASSIKTFCSTLSRDGMFVVTIKPLKQGSKCSLEFSIPGSESVLSTSTRVLYSITINKDLNIIASPGDPFKRLVSHPGMAVMFIDLPEDERVRIDEYLKTLL